MEGKWKAPGFYLDQVNLLFEIATTIWEWQKNLLKGPSCISWASGSYSFTIKTKCGMYHSILRLVSIHNYMVVKKGLRVLPNTLTTHETGPHVELFIYLRGLFTLRNIFVKNYRYYKCVTEGRGIKKWLVDMFLENNSLIHPLNLSVIEMPCLNGLPCLNLVMHLNVYTTPINKTYLGGSWMCVPSMKFEFTNQQSDKAMGPQIHSKKCWKLLKENANRTHNWKKI